MTLSLLSHVLLTERHRQRAASGGGFSVPAMMEREGPASADPVLVSTTRGTFVQTRRTTEGFYRFAFFRCPLEDEGEVLVRIHDTVWNLSAASRWGNRFRTPREAILRMRSSQLQPKAVILSRTLAESFAGQEVPEGKVTLVDGLHVIVAPLPQDSAIVTAAPTVLGVYTRVGDHIGLQLYNVQQTLMVIKNDGNLD
jgi:hypothetical protein